VVTSTLAKFARQTFPINGIGSVTLVPARRTLLIVFGSLFFLIGIINAANGGGNASVPFFVIGAISIFVALSRKSGLLIKTASGDIRAMEGSEQTLKRVQDAIEQAATIRG
jgi:hypothetical protein